MCRCSRAGPVPGGGLPEGIAEWTATTPDPAYGAPAADLLLSPRVAPQMIGLGLLEAIPVADILAFADPDDANSDGIPGRAKIVPSVQFGVPTIKEQTAAAFAGDIGISTPPHPDPWADCTIRQPTCIGAKHGQEPGLHDGLEVDGEGLDLVSFYLRSLGVPGRLGLNDPRVLTGKAVFHRHGCQYCHQPKFVAHRLMTHPSKAFN